MNLQTNRILRTAAISAALLLAAWVFLRFLLKPTAPFIIAFLISGVLNKPCTLLQLHLHLPRRLCALICTLCFFALFLLLAKSLISQGITHMGSLLRSMPDADTILENTAAAFERVFSRSLPELAPKLGELAGRLIRSSTSLTLQLREKLTGLAAYAASLIPNTFLFAAVLPTACYLFLCEHSAILHFAREHLPPTAAVRIAMLRDVFYTAASGYLRAVLLMSLVTFCLLLCGLSLIRLPNPLSAALLISLMDALPVFGCGFALIPWALTSLICGEYSRAVGLSLIYLSAALTRNIFEAQLLGRQAGLHPLVSLASVYIGVQFFGAYGLFMPPLITFIKQLLRPHANAQPQ